MVSSKFVERNTFFDRKKKRENVQKMATWNQWVKRLKIKFLMNMIIYMNLEY